jgi:hypothetical protein
MPLLLFHPPHLFGRHNPPPHHTLIALLPLHISWLLFAIGGDGIIVLSPLPMDARENISCRGAAITNTNMQVG